MNPNNNTAVATKTNGDVLRSRLQGEHFKTAVQQVLPKHLTPERFVRVALMAMTRTPKLADCEPASLIQCLLTLSQLGLEPDSRRAHLIPFGKQVQLIIDYKGYAELIYNTGLVSTIHADIVCANDEFVWDRGEVKKHTYGWTDRGDVVGVYAIIKFKDGTEKADRMSREEVEAVRKRSRAANGGPWVTDWNEMAKKTVFRRLVKWVKLSPEQRDAIEADDDQFELNRVASAKGTFGSDATVGLFSASEQQALEAETLHTNGDNGEGTDPQNTPPEPEPKKEQTRRAAAKSSSPASAAAERVEAKSAAAPVQERQTPPAQAAKPTLANDKALLASWMQENNLAWGQMQPVVAEEIGGWASSISSFEELNNNQAKAIYAGREGLAAALNLADVNND